MDLGLIEPVVIELRQFTVPQINEDSLEEIKRGSGTHFDPKVVEAFLSALPDILKIRSEHQDEELALTHAL